MPRNMIEDDDIARNLRAIRGGELDKSVESQSDADRASNGGKFPPAPADPNNPQLGVSPMLPKKDAISALLAAANIPVGRVAGAKAAPAPDPQAAQGTRVDIQPPPDVQMPDAVIPRGIDPEIKRRALQQAAWAHAIHGLADKTTATPLSARMGQQPHVAESPLADAAQSMALAPLAEEQARAEHDQQIAHTLNEYNKARAGLQAKTLIGEYAQQMGLAKAVVGADAKKTVAETGADAKGATDSSRERIEAQKAQTMHDMLELRRKNVFDAIDKRHADKMDDKALEETRYDPKRDAPNSAEAAKRGNLVLGEKGLSDLINLYKTDPTSATTGHVFKFGDFRFPVGTNAQKVDQARKFAHEALLQAAPRMGTRMSGSILADVLGHTGTEDAPTTVKGLEIALDNLTQIREEDESAKPRYDWDKKGPKEGFKIAPYTSAKDPAKGATLQPKPTAVEEERVPVIAPDGRRGTVPKSKLAEKLKAGYKNAQ